MRFSQLSFQELKFLITFAGVYFVFYSLYFLIPDDVLRNIIYYHGIVSISADLINLFTATENVSAAQNKLMSQRAILEVVRGCDGSGSMFLIMAGVIAFSCSLKHKLIGLLTGVCLLYLLNQIRIVGLYYVVAYRSEWFLPIHTYFAPTFIVMLSVMFFAWWAYSVRLNKQNSS